MELSELRQKSSAKVLIRGPSGSGKTINSAEIALTVAGEGYDVLFADMESEGSDTMLKLVEHGEYSEEDLATLSYREIGSYDAFMKAINDASGFDLLVLDPMDHKHTYVLREVAEAATKSGADWNEYPQIYDQEKKIMSGISDMNTNVVCTLDPESGKKDKPKGAQVNIHGYYGIVVDVFKSGDSWGHKIDNWIGRSDLIGGELTNTELHEAISKEILERTG